MKANKALEFEVPLRQCQDCGQMKPEYGFVGVSEEDGKRTRHLCAACYNAIYTERAGLPKLEKVDFEPIVRHDGFGKAHIFHFIVHLTTGLGIKAFELVEGRPGGYMFMVLEAPDTPVQEAYDKLIAKLEAGIAVHYLESSDFPSAPSQNRLYVKGLAVNGRIDEDEHGPVVVVDGKDMSWKEFGRCVSSAMGFNFRLEIFDPGDSPEITPHPKRPNALRWLPELEQEGSGERMHH